MSSESSPLLQTQEALAAGESPPSQTSSNARLGRALAIAGGALDWRQYPRDFWLYTLIRFLAGFGGTIIGATWLPFAQVAVCRHYLDERGQLPPGQDPPEELCYDYEVLARAGFLINLLVTVSAVVATIMLLPMGFLADKRGKRLALILNVAGTILYYGFITAVATVRVVPLWCFYLAPIFLLIGGGPWATSALVYAAISNKLTPQQRTAAFSIMEAASVIANVIGSILTADILFNHNWVSFLIAMIIFFLMLILAFFITDRVSGSRRDVSTEEAASHTVERELLLGDAVPHNHHISDQVPTLENLMRSKAAMLLTCFGSFFLIYMSKASTVFLIPWIWFRFNEPLGHAGLVSSIRAIVSLFLYIILLPLASSWLTEARKLNTSVKDLKLSTWGIFLSLAGFFVAAFATNLPTFAFGFAVVVLGSGAAITLLSFLASYVDAELSGRLFTAISAIGIIGSLVGMPIMEAAYNWGINLEPEAIGFQFLVSGILQLFVLMLLVYLYKIQYSESG